MFFRQVEELLTGLESWDDYVYRDAQLSAYVDRELQAVKKTTFMFIPKESLNLEEPPFSLIPEDLVGELNKFLFMNAGLGNLCPTKEGVKFKVCVPCALIGIQTSMNEIHLILGCTRYEQARRDMNIHELIYNIVQQYGEGEQAYEAFWGKRANLHVQQLTWRLECAVKLREIYLEDVPVLKPLYYRY